MAALTHSERAGQGVGRARLGYAAALALVVACHLPSLGFGFLRSWDDPMHVTENRLLLAPGEASLREHLTTPALGYPIPVTIASYRVQAALTGLSNAWAFHLGNVALLLGSALLVLGIARRLGLSQVGATLAVFVYGLHPVVAEPVSWISGRKDLLAGAFGLLAVWLAWPPASRARRFGSLACYALALLSKPSAAPVFVPALLLLLWFGAARDGSGEEVPRSAVQKLRAAALFAWPYLLLLAPVVVLGTLGQQAVGAVADGAREGASWARSVGYGLGHHVALLLMWEEPTAKYLPSPWPPGFVPGIDLAPVVLGAAVALALWRLSGAPRRAVLFGVLWSAVTYLPNSGLIPLSRQFADSYVYLPLMGLAWFAGGCADALVQRARGGGVRLVAALPWAVAALLAMLLLPSAARFHDDEALWSHARARFPHSERVCRQWANGVAGVSGVLAGLEATDACIGQFGDRLFVKNRGFLLFQAGRREEARAWLVRADAANPGDPVVASYLRALGPAQASAQP